MSVDAASKRVNGKICNEGEAGAIEEKTRGDADRKTRQRRA